MKSREPSTRPRGHGRRLVGRDPPSGAYWSAPSSSSDDAGQFRIGQHALCWVHAERLVHKLVPANDKQRNAIENAKRMIWWFYRQLKEYKLRGRAHERAATLTARFARIFERAPTGYVTLDKLIKRLHANGQELLRVLGASDTSRSIPTASENDIRTVVTKRKISGGTVSDRGRTPET